MGKGGLYGKRTKQEHPKSPRESASTTSTSSGIRVREKSESELRYGGYTAKQSYDTSLATTTKRKYAQNRGRKKKR